MGFKKWYIEGMKRDINKLKNYKSNREKKKEIDKLRVIRKQLKEEKDKLNKDIKKGKPIKCPDCGSINIEVFSMIVYYFIVPFATIGSGCIISIFFWPFLPIFLIVGVAQFIYAIVSIGKNKGRYICRCKKKSCKYKWKT